MASQLGAAVKSFPEDVRVAVVASGGLSHFIVDEELDLRVLHTLQTHDHAALRAIPRGALNSGSSEILNWVTTAGAVEFLRQYWMPIAGSWNSAKSRLGSVDLGWLRAKNHLAVSSELNYAH
ncbi:hypothetical protein FAZ69_07895 [Trinickia terrae]|uniref:Extradiol ring-cleavage dioxygenase class III enzyme subunit B domain-containing protein n=1 Tax=Trinickia terrae TaxID=2571161 RepID=A0A4U1I9C4_9BURK|nr:hypothetical protein [Trinickia terrae]TKC90072.1 hypothetical protein FAZ69_07895 [Trinickia terrae]